MEEIFTTNRKYLTGILTGFILAIIIFLAHSWYQGNQSPVDGVVDVQSGVALREGVEDSSATNTSQQGIEISGEMTPETPHSPQLQRLALILREAGRMLERMERDINIIKESQLATANR